MKQRTPFSGPRRFLTPTLTVVLLTFFVVGCRPDLPVPHAQSSTTSESAEWIVRMEPDAPLLQVPRVVRVHVQATQDIDKERVFLIRGEVTKYHLRQLEQNELTKTLQARMVPAVAWLENARELVIAPTEVLEPGQTYAVASGEPAKAEHFVVAMEDEVPLLLRIWPPVEVPAAFGIFCGDDALPDFVMGAQLEPLGPRGLVRRGISANGPGETCLRFQVPGRWPYRGEGSPWVLPPILELPGLSGPALRIEPAVFASTAEVANEIMPLQCEHGEVPFGPGCADVMDDRIVVRVPEGELFWAVTGDGIKKWVMTKSKERFVIKDLVPETNLSFDVVTVDTVGRTQRETFMATTKSLSAHVVLNEVLANPLGPEPHQEWVELYNDGQVETSLLGYRILDIGGDTVLPDVLLPPGQFALVVNEAFVEDDEVDVCPAKETILVRVPTLGKTGLSNSGEPLRLADAEGHFISRFPALPKPKAGFSVSRLTPDAPDGVSSSFAVSEPTPGTRNMDGSIP